MSEKKDLREDLADLAHRQWSGWMRYLFGKCSPGRDKGSLEIPAWAVERWKRQAATDYADLCGDEQDSDRVEADKFLALLRTHGIAPREPIDVARLIPPPGPAGVSPPPRCTCGVITYVPAHTRVDPGACGHHPTCPLTAIDG